MLKRTVLIATLCVAATASAEERAAHSFRVTPLAQLERQAQERTHGTARVPLSSTDEPNYLRAFSLTPKAAEPMQKLFHAALFEGAVDTSVKSVMGLRIAELLDAPYVAAHMEKVLASSERGRALLKALQSGDLDSLAPADRLGINYAEWLTQDVHGVSEEDFRRVRAYYNDAQLVELTTTTCFFNYLTRFTEALRLPVEAQLPAAPQSEVQTPIARVALISDAEMETLDRARSQQSQQVKSMLGIGMANSMRAMDLSPEVASAWWAYGNASRAYDSVSRELKLQISFAVSMANGCRYCTLHQVLGLKRLGVSTSKLMQMRKDDSALTPDELAAVQFARKLTSEPWAVTDADYQTLESHFGKQGALEVVMQTCNFAYMNHFTDGLRLPSEDEAVKTYREVYGTDFARINK